MKTFTLSYKREEIRLMDIAIEDPNMTPESIADGLSNRQLVWVGDRIVKDGQTVARVCNHVHLEGKYPTDFQFTQIEG